jgi:signal transduction histidine kinase
VRTIEQSARRISELVKAVKAYSYMDRAPLQEADVHEGLENTLTMLAHRLEGVQVNRDYDRQLPMICCYGSELNQVWTHLFTNAADALNGSGEIVVQTSQVDGHVAVEITDSGPGIPEAIRSRIFEPFFSTKGMYDRNGLGLLNSHRIVTDRHGGSITFDSQPGRTSFRVVLPIEPPKRAISSGAPIQ